MLESFLSLSPAALLFVCVLLPNLIAAPFVLAIMKRALPSVEGDNVVLGPTVGFIGTSFALLLTLLMVSIWADQTASQQTLFDELTTVQTILIESRTVAPDRAPALKTSALKYVELMRERELDATPPVGGDPAVQRIFEDTLLMIRDLERAMAVDPQRRSESQGFFAETRQWTEQREDRVNKPSGQLDEIMMAVLLALAIFTIVTFALLPSTTSAWAKWTQTLGVATTVGLGLFLVFYISSRSFERTAEDQQIERVQEALAIVDDRPVAREQPPTPTPVAPR